MTKNQEQSPQQEHCGIVSAVFSQSLLERGGVSSTHASVDDYLHNELVGTLSYDVDDLDNKFLIPKSTLDRILLDRLVRNVTMGTSCEMAQWKVPVNMKDKHFVPWLAGRMKSVCAHEGTGAQESIAQQLLGLPTRDPTCPNALGSMCAAADVRAYQETMTTRQGDNLYYDLMVARYLRMPHNVYITRRERNRPSGGYLAGMARASQKAPQVEARGSRTEAPAER
ncbi:MAG: hypothetical protein M1813_009242 [Trichoglossum hirsutum]|nr:MAG: hypothetical protein M1813_009242 [Trichoglossum hirsutum]